ncbi:MAG: hypothetical protein NTY16_04860 [Deltaproteobacteria bacterium]|nr:hypothetical protein [Deltaproteobacteria bacterium]
MINQQTNQVIWITSLELIEKTGISRATLNNYIKMDILPRPVVKKPVDPKVRAKRLGYFPESALATIDQIKRLKQDGCSMSMIMEKLKSCSIGMVAEETIKMENLSQEPLTGKITPEADQIRCEAILNRLLRQHTPALTFFCVLVIDLQDSTRLCAELPPEEYFELLNQLWNCAGLVFNKYNGICSKHPGQGMIGCFLKKEDNQYLINAIQCALELREGMKRFNEVWKLRKGWSNELYINIGMNEGWEYLGFIQSPSGIELASLGDAVSHAIKLAEFASDGSIWLTKSFINKMNSEEKKQIRYGIRHFEQNREVLLSYSFARIADMLMHDQSKSRQFMDIATLAVTEVISKV